MHMPSQNSGKNIRSKRKLLIYPRFQLLLIITNLSVILSFFAIAWVGAQNALLDLKPAAGLSGMEAEFFRKYLDYQAASLQKALFIALGVGVLVAGGATLIISHRIAGPLVRLQNFFRSIQEGKTPVPQITFRDGDYLRELEPLINGALERIQRSKQSQPRPLLSLVRPPISNDDEGEAA